MWELVEALEVIRSLEKRISKVGWHVALAGGVLERGASDHDLDLVVFPDHNERRPPFYDAVVALGWKRTHTVKQMQANFVKIGTGDTKCVEVWRDKKDRRIDLIIV